MKAYMVKENKEMDVQKLVELEGETDKPTIRAGDFNTPLLVTERSNGQKLLRI